MSVSSQSSSSSQSMVAKKRRPLFQSLFACCRAMDDGGKAPRRKLPLLPKRYEIQFTLRQTLFGQVSCAIDKKRNKRVAIKFSYKNDRFFVSGEDPRVEANILQSFIDSQNSRYSTVDSPPSPSSRAPEPPISTMSTLSLSRTSSKNSVSAIRSSSISPRASTDSAKGFWHPNIIKYYGSQEDKDKVWTVLEFAARGELLDHITNSPGGKLKEIETARIACKLASALEFCHHNGIAHLDVSPENILFTREWQVKLCDFGLAQRMDKNGFVTRPHSAGKPNYMAPETYSSDKSNSTMSSWVKSRKPEKKIFLGGPADIFSLGIVIFLCITGVLPYKYPTSFDMRFMLVTGGRNDLAKLLRRWRISISENALDLLSRMLMRTPEDRITAGEILKHPWIIENSKCSSQTHEAG